MKFQVSYRFFGQRGASIRGGEVVIEAESESAALQWFSEVSSTWPEAKAERRVDATRMIDEHIGWDEAIEAMAQISAEEWEEFIQAVKTERGLSG